MLSVDSVDPLEQLYVLGVHREMPVTALSNPPRHLLRRRSPRTEDNRDDVVLFDHSCEDLGVPVGSLQFRENLPVDLPTPIYRDLLFRVELPNQVTTEVGAVEEPTVQGRQLLGNIRSKSVRQADAECSRPAQSLIKLIVGSGILECGKGTADVPTGASIGASKARPETRPGAFATPQADLLILPFVSLTA